MVVNSTSDQKVLSSHPTGKRQTFFFFPLFSTQFKKFARWVLKSFSSGSQIFILQLQKIFPVRKLFMIWVKIKNPLKPFDNLSQVLIDQRHLSVTRTFFNLRQSYLLGRAEKKLLCKHGDRLSQICRESAWMENQTKHGDGSDGSDGSDRSSDGDNWDLLRSSSFVLQQCMSNSIPGGKNGSQTFLLIFSLSFNKCQTTCFSHSHAKHSR